MPAWRSWLSKWRERGTRGTGEKEKRRRGGNGEIAKGSAGEVRSLLWVANEIGYLEKLVYEKLRNASMELSAWLSNQIKALKVVVK